MRSFMGILLAVGLGLAGAASAADPPVSADEAKKKAEANWDSTGAGSPATLETKHLLLVAPQAMEKQLKEVGAMLEKAHDQAWMALQFDKEAVLPGKVTVYLFAERDHFAAFVRRVEKRRLQPDETGSNMPADTWLHLAASPPRGKQGLGVEGQAAEQLAVLLLSRRAGNSTPLPDWLVAGFGRATFYHAAPRDKATLNDRRLAARMSRNLGPAEIWGGSLDAESAPALRGSLVDFMAYGPGAAKFPAFVAGFAPEEGREKKTTWQALEAAGLKGDRVRTAWKTWVLSR
jgi:hypothetical protein